MIKVDRIKWCTKCKVHKAVKEFRYDKRYSDGLFVWCKACCCKATRIWQDKNPDKVKVSHNRFIKNNPEKVKSWHANEYKNNAEHGKKRQKIWRIKNPDHNKQYKKANPDKIKLIERRHSIKRRSTPEGNINCKIGSGFRSDLGENKNNIHWGESVPYTCEEATADQESKCYNKMTRENFKSHGGVAIHHVIPRKLSHFTSTKDPAFQKCWALKNMYPLWAEDHRALHSRLDPELTALMLTDPTEEQIEKLCRKHLKYTLEHSIHKFRKNK